MSTAADVVPYLQAWLDARAPVTQAKADFATAQAAVISARQAVQTAVTSGGKTAAQAQADIQTWLDAQAVYVTRDAALRAALADADQKRATFEQMGVLASTGGTVPPFAG